MASGVRSAVPKLRSRAQGAAVPLDETDKRLLNALQSRFPLDPRPFEAVAREAGMDEAEAMERTAQLLRRAHHPGDHADLRHDRARLQLDAGRREGRLGATRTAPRAIINEHPGVSHNYLRNHDFNLWFTIATAPDSKLGLDGTLEVLRTLSGAESIRKLPTLTMFKINMNLEMEGGTDKLAAPVEAVEPAAARPGSDRRLRRGGDPRAAGPDGGAARTPTRPPPSGSASRSSACSSTSRGWSSARCCAAWRRSCSTAAPGFSANGMGVWKVPEDQIAEIGPRMAAVRGVSHCYRRPDLSRLALQRLHDGARPLEGGVRRGARRRRRRSAG